MNALKCEMDRDCAQTVTHIGEKGYVYCASHGVNRRLSGYERCRKLRMWELKQLEGGKPLTSYKLVLKPKDPQS